MAQLPEGWIQQMDQQSQRPFFVNTKTGESFWELPMESTGERGKNSSGSLLNELGHALLGGKHQGSSAAQVIGSAISGKPTSHASHSNHSSSTTAAVEAVLGHGTKSKIVGKLIDKAMNHK